MLSQVEFIPEELKCERLYEMNMQRKKWCEGFLM